jgi:AraC-like DNA-binding protein
MSKPRPSSVTPKTNNIITPSLSPCSIPYRWSLHEGRSVSTYLDINQPSAEWPLYRNEFTQLLIFGQSARCVMRWIERGHIRERAVSTPGACLIAARTPFALDWKNRAPLTMLYVESELIRETLGRPLREVAFFGESLIAMHDMQAMQWMHLLTRLNQPRRATECLYLECISTLLVIHLLGVANLVAQSNSVASAKLPVDTFNRIHNFVTENLADKITLDQLARVAALSRSHFVRLFKGSAGMSPYHYVVRQRVLRACELLQSTQHRITEIGFAVGFNDVADFNHMFKKFMQCSPRQFRKMRHPKFPV